jgi:hypothetical protein
MYSPRSLELAEIEVSLAASENGIEPFYFCRKSYVPPRRYAAGSIDVHEGSAVDWEHNTGNEVRFVGSQKQRGIGDVQAVPILWRSDARVSGRGLIGGSSELVWKA